MVSERRRMRYEREKLDVRGGKVSQRTRRVQVVFGAVELRSHFAPRQYAAFAERKATIAEQAKAWTPAGAIRTATSTGRVGIEKMHKSMLAASVALVCGLLAGCSEPAVVPSTPAPPNANAAAPVAPAPAEAVPHVVRGRLRFVDGYQAGVNVAAAQGKPILLYFTTTPCYWCQKLVADAFHDETVVSLSNRFVCVLVDAEREPEVVQHFGVRAYPTIQFVSTRGQPLNQMIGKQPNQVLVRQMHAALQGLARADANGIATQ